GHSQKGETGMMINARQWGIAAVLASAMALSAGTPSLAGSIPSGTLGVKAAAPDNAIDVRWRRGGGVAAGIAAGALLGAGIAATTAPGYYPSYGYYPGYGYGAYAYDAAPVYGGPVYVTPYSSYAYPN